MGESCQSKNKSDVCDEVKMHLVEASHNEILFEKRGYEAYSQPIDNSTRMLKDNLLKEEEIINGFLSSLKLDHLFNNDLGIHSK